MKKGLILTTILMVLFYCTPNLWAFSPEVRFDMLKTKLSQQLKAQEFSKALTTIDELKALGIPVPASLDYFEGKALYESGKKYEAYLKLEKFINTHGKKSKYYNKAIAYLVKSEDSYNAVKVRRSQAQAREVERQRQIAETKRSIAEIERSIVALENKLLDEAAEYEANREIINDTETGLMWTDFSFEKYERKHPHIQRRVSSKNEAVSYCEDLALNNYSDWRIPTMREFSTVFKNSFRSPLDWSSISSSHFWVRGSQEFSQPRALCDGCGGPEIIHNDRIYYVDSSLSSLKRSGRTRGTLPLCVRSTSAERFKQFFNHQYTLFQRNGRSLMMDDTYILRERNYKKSGRYDVTTETVTFTNVNSSNSYSAASSYCSGLKLAGYRDWRLPTEDDFLNVLPCKYYKDLRFPQSGSRSDIWGEREGVIFDDPVYLDVSKCKVFDRDVRRGKDDFSIRCVRDVEE